MASDSMAADAAPGHLLFLRETTLFAQPLNAATLALTGEAVRVADDIQVSMSNGRAAFSVSANGVLAYRGGGGMNSRSGLAWFDRTGKRLALLLGGTATQNYRLSVLDLTNGMTSAVTDTNTTVNDPAWLPDSQTIGYGAFKAGRQIFTQQIGQSTATQVVTSADEVKWLDVSVAAHGAGREVAVITHWTSLLTKK